MFGLRYIKAAPTDYIIHYRNGKICRQGPGLSFFYYAPSATLVRVPIGSAEIPFVFAQTTADFQTVNIQGQISYRVSQPATLASMLDYSLDARGHHASEDPEKLPERLINIARMVSGQVIQQRPLRDSLTAMDSLGGHVLKSMREHEVIRSMGVEVLAVSVLAIAPTPEISKFLEAEVREGLQRKSDEAVYARRNAAVEQERKIKESELNTELLVEEKQRQKQEAHLTGAIALEQQRSDLVERKAANDRKQADAQAYALEVTLAQIKQVDWRVLMALTSGKSTTHTQLAMAFRELAENAQKIGELNISPDLLTALTKEP